MADDDIMNRLKSMVFPLLSLSVVYYVRNYFDAENALQLLVLRTVFTVCQIINMGATMYVSNKINNRVKTEKDAPKTVKLSDSEKISEAEYDLKESQKLLIGAIIPVIIAGIMHVRFGYIIPFAMSSVMVFNNLTSKPLFRIYLLGHDAVDELKRPFGFYGPNRADGVMAFFTNPEAYLKNWKERINEKPLSASKKRKLMRKKAAGKGT